MKAITLLPTVLALILGSALVLSCKRKSADHQQVKAIDNLLQNASDARQVHVCGRKPGTKSIRGENVWLKKPETLPKDMPSDLKTVVEETLDLVPTSSLQYLARIGARIVFESRPPAACVQTPDGKPTPDLAYFQKFLKDTQPLSCIQPDEQGHPVLYFGQLNRQNAADAQGRDHDTQASGKTQPIQISNAQVVRSDLVRLIGLLYSRYLPTVFKAAAKSLKASSQDGHERSAELNEKITELEKVTNSFLSLRSELTAQFKKDAGDALKPVEGDISGDPGKEKVFEEYVMAEIYDSYYCSLQTRRDFVFHPKFKGTRTLFFEKLEPLFHIDLAATAETEPDSSSSAK